MDGLISRSDEDSEPDVSIDSARTYATPAWLLVLYYQMSGVTPASDVRLDRSTTNRIAVAPYELAP